MNDPIPLEERLAILEEAWEKMLLLLEGLLARIESLEAERARRGARY